MTNANSLTLASVKEVKALVSAGAATHADAIVRVDAVLTRNGLADGKRARWTRLREWLLSEQTKNEQAKSV